MAAINICKPGVPYNAIGGVIEDYVTARGLSTTRNYCGLPLSLLLPQPPRCPGGALRVRNAVHPCALGPSGVSQNL